MEVGEVGGTGAQSQSQSGMGLGDNGPKWRRLETWLGVLVASERKEDAKAPLLAPAPSF